jgi:hypothetical protein
MFTIAQENSEIKTKIAVILQCYLLGQRCYPLSNVCIRLRGEIIGSRSLRTVNCGAAFQPVHWEMTGKMQVPVAIPPVLKHGFASLRSQ